MSVTRLFILSLITINIQNVQFDQDYFNLLGKIDFITQQFFLTNNLGNIEHEIHMKYATILDHTFETKSSLSDFMVELAFLAPEDLETISEEEKSQIDTLRAIIWKH